MISYFTQPKCPYCGSTNRSPGSSRTCNDCGREFRPGEKTVSPLVAGLVIGAVLLVVIWAIWSVA